MTPPALTPAARRSTAGGHTPRGAVARQSADRKAGHAQTIGRRNAPAGPRRLSGPLQGRTVPQEGRPRPVSAPAQTAPRRREGRPRPAGAPVVQISPRGDARARQQTVSRRGRLGSLAHALVDHPLLDRLIRGRVWIPLLGVLLAGIVAMQVEVLKYGASIGDALANTTALQSRQEVLQASVAQLESAARIERLAERMGMVMPLPGEQTFVRADPQQLGRALALIRPADPASFAAATAQLVSQAAASAALVPNGLGAASAGSAAGLAAMGGATAGSVTTATGGAG